MARPTQRGRFDSPLQTWARAAMARAREAGMSRPPRCSRAPMHHGDHGRDENRPEPDQVPRGAEVADVEGPGGGPRGDRRGDQGHRDGRAEPLQGRGRPAAPPQQARQQQEGGEGQGVGLDGVGPRRRGEQHGRGTEQGADPPGAGSHHATTNAITPTSRASSDSWLATRSPSSMSAPSSIRVAAHGIHTAHAPTTASCPIGAQDPDHHADGQPGQGHGSGEPDGLRLLREGEHERHGDPGQCRGPERQQCAPGRGRGRVAAQIPTASAVAAVVTSAPGRASRLSADEAVAAALRNRPNAPTVLSSTSWESPPGRDAREAASIAMLVSAGTVIAAAVHAAESVALATAATTQADGDQQCGPAQPAPCAQPEPTVQQEQGGARVAANATAGYERGVGDPVLREQPEHGGGDEVDRGQPGGDDGQGLGRARQASCAAGSPARRRRRWRPASARPARTPRGGPRPPRRRPPRR